MVKGGTSDAYPMPQSVFGPFLTLIVLLAGGIVFGIYKAIPWTFPTPDSDFSSFVRTAGGTPAGISAYVHENPDYMRTRDGLLALIWLGRTQPAHRDAAEAELDALLTELIEDRIPTPEPSRHAEDRARTRLRLLQEIRDKASWESSQPGGPQGLFDIARRAAAAVREDVEPAQPTPPAPN